MAKYEKYLIKEPQTVKLAHHEVQEVKGGTWPPLVCLNKDLLPGSAVSIMFRWVWAVPEPNDHMPRHSHSTDEVLLHFGSDPNNPTDLGAECEITLGDEKIKIDTTSALYIPKGVEHNPTIWKRVDRPILRVAVVIGEYD